MAKVIFFGTPEYVIPIPEALKKAGYEIVAVVTQPPKPVGRKKELTPSPVAKWAEKHNIPISTKFSSLYSSEKIDVGVLAAYGRIIPKEVIDYFPYGILNVHPSLLPKYRGASPVQAAILNGDKETGVTIIKLDEEVDHGPIIHQFREPIKENDTTGTLREQLFEKAAESLPEIINDYINGKVKPKEQEHEQATFTTLIKKSDGFIKLSAFQASLISPRDVATALQVFDSEVAQTRGGVPLQAQRLGCFIRAMSPWPGAWTILRPSQNSGLREGKQLKILKAHLEDGKLVLDIVQLEGKKPVSWTQFKQGYPKAKFN